MGYLHDLSSSSTLRSLVFWYVFNSLVPRNEYNSLQENTVLRIINRDNFLHRQQFCKINALSHFLTCRKMRFYNASLVTIELQTC
jgi:hypothetical protein